MLLRILVLTVLYAASPTLLAAQDQACWQIEPTEWRWLPSEQNPVPPRPVEDGGLQVVPPIFSLDSVLGTNVLGNETPNHRLVLPRIEPRTLRRGLWTVRGDTLFLSWAGPFAGFEGRFTPFSMDSDSVPGVAGEWQDYNLAGDMWRTDAILRSVECPPGSGVLFAQTCTQASCLARADLSLHHAGPRVSRTGWRPKWSRAS